MTLFKCDLCGLEKEGKILKWYEIYDNEYRGINLQDDIIYTCLSCGAKICKECKEHFIKTSKWYGWEKAICPKCKKSFSPNVENEIKRAPVTSKSMREDSYVSVIEENIQNKQDKQLEITNKDKTKYPALNVISAAYQFLAWLSAFISLLTFVIFLINDGVNIISIISIVIGAILLISFLAASEIIRLFIDIESNTRTFSRYQNEK